MVLAFGITAVITLVVGGSILSSRTAMTSSTAEMVASSQLRRGLEAMSRELASARPDEITNVPADGAWRTAISFRVPEDRTGDGVVLNAFGDITEWSDTITYQLVAGNLCQRVLAPAGTARTLAHHVTGLQFRRLAATPTTVEIQMTITTPLDEGQTVTRALTTRTHLRN